MAKPSISTLGELKKSDYQAKTVKEEIRLNLIKKLSKKEPVFNDIIGYEDTVIPQMESAILAKHNMLFLGLRGQAKTRMAREMTLLLDEYVPYVKDAPLLDDPLAPFSRFALDAIAEYGDNTPIAWLHRSERYSEKLATPDVSVSDLIGDVDPIKAATQKLSYADERVIHFGMIPRANRGIFVINELPDLQARIQVSLFNILQEGDIQIRGFNLRLPLDIQFIFTANPEDYTNRGSIVTPLKDRIESQILTHYPKSITLAKSITIQEARISEEQKKKIHVPELLSTLIEQIAFEARDSEYVDQKSGVSARLTIAAYELLVSAAERRLLLNNEKSTTARISDLLAVVPAITGKIELVYEGEQEGAGNVAWYLIGKAIRTVFSQHFENPEASKKRKDKVSEYHKIIAWFNQNNHLDLMQDLSEKEYNAILQKVDGLEELVKTKKSNIDKKEQALYQEFLLHGLAEFSQISKHRLEKGAQFKDIMSGMINLDLDFDNDQEE